MPKSEKQRPTVYAKDRNEWHDWLLKNHAVSSGVLLIYYKKGSGKLSVSYDEAVEEALSFGWIDSRVNSLDEERYMQVFTPRKPRSSWSKLNKQRVEKLIKRGLMTAVGMEKVEAAKRDGSWNTLDAIEDLKIPADFMEALSSNKKAHDNFMAFSDSSKKIILQWIRDAKRPETRKRRIDKTVELAGENKKPYP
ncbi:MAG TPA: YdeI/OmpD-associated family protein [Methanotrichaceae archaeon]|nr:YdeI/OmpD-associated family protein [Methanotrichaceae archaeon]